MKKRTKDLTGEKFGKLTVIGFDSYKNIGNSTSRSAHWKCQCECGNMVMLDTSSLKYNGRKTCGCSQKSTNGLYGSRLYKIWTGMKQRCFNPNDTQYQNYGGRGIIICDEWRNDFTSFFNWATNNGYKEGLTIDRENVNGNYEPTNCRWATQKEQMRNTRFNRNLTIDGETKIVAEWIDTSTIKPKTFRERVRSNVSEDRILQTDIRTRIFMEINGKKLSVKELSDLTGINQDTIRRRINKGCSYEDVIKPAKIGNNQWS